MTYPLRRSIFQLLLLFSLASLPGFAPCRAAELTVLHTFSADSPNRAKAKGIVKLDGARPLFPLIQGHDGALYGTTIDGGTHGNGVVFKVNPDGTGFAVLHSFETLGFGMLVGLVNKGGASPSGALVQADNGTLYGAAREGGASGSGVIFKLDPDGTNFGVVHEFSQWGRDLMGRNSGGTGPVALTLAMDGRLYGTTIFGGDGGKGLIFRLARSGKEFQVLHTFRGVIYDNNINEGGALPGVTPVFGRDGALYGTTNIGGKYGYGVVYRMTTDGKQFIVLHHFQRKGPGFEANGVFPEGPLAASDNGLLYGCARQGGTDDTGVLFQLHQDGSGFTILHPFSHTENDGADGWLPAATPVLGRDDRLYGLTSAGGANGVGTVFWASTDGAKFVVLHDFSILDAQRRNADGAYPRAGLIQGRDGALYGVTASGGPNGTGTVFRLVPPHAR